MLQANTGVNHKNPQKTPTST